MKQKMTTGAFACQTTSQLLSTEQELSLEWGNALRQQFALAPKAFADGGHLTDEVYQSESKKIGEFCVRNFMALMLRYYSTLSFAKAKRIQWLGSGLLREVAMFIEGVNMEFNFTFRDVCAFACERVRIVAKENGISSHAVNIVPGDFLGHWEPYGDPRESGLLYAGQFIQLFPPEEARKIMNILGAFLYNPRGARIRDRRICLVHPLEEDNVGADWKHSFLHDINDFIGWASKGNGPVKAEVMEKQKYYGGPPLGHVYSFIVLSVA